MLSMDSSARWRGWRCSWWRRLRGRCRESRNLRGKWYLKLDWWDRLVWILKRRQKHCLRRYFCFNGISIRWNKYRHACNIRVLVPIPQPNDNSHHESHDTQSHDNPNDKQPLPTASSCDMFIVGHTPSQPSQLFSTLPIQRTVFNWISIWRRTSVMVEFWRKPKSKMSIGRAIRSARRNGRRVSRRGKRSRVFGYSW